MTDQPSARRRFVASPQGARWEGVEHKPYKEDGRDLFKDISRQTLFSRTDLAGELRYFEVSAGGFSTLERHHHVHAVLVLRGEGTALVGSEVLDLQTNDLITVPPLTWHQFKAAPGKPLGFLCMVNAVRDKPQLPSDADLASMTSDPAIARFLKT